MIKKLIFLMIKGYRYGISPVFSPCCRFFPTCSEYALDAISKYGLRRGGYLSIKRILRCHPLGSSGYDPVP